MSYDPRNPKIDIYIDGHYNCSTNFSRTVKEAREKYLTKNKHLEPKTVKLVKSK